MLTQTGPLHIVGDTADRPTAGAPGVQYGYLFWDSTVESLYVYDGTAWKLVGGGLTPPPAPSATIYVDGTSGNDANPGTLAAPVKTLQRAYDLSGVAYETTVQIIGATLSLGGGTDQLTFMTLPKSAARVTVKGAPATSFDGLIHAVQSSTAYNAGTVEFVTITPVATLGSAPDGFFVRYVDGDLAGCVFPISKVVGNTLTLTSIRQPANGDHFVLERPTTTLSYEGALVTQLQAQNLVFNNVKLATVGPVASSVFSVSGYGLFGFLESWISSSLNANDRATLALGSDLDNGATAPLDSGVFHLAGDVSNSDGALLISNSVLISGRIAQGRNGGSSGGTLSFMHVEHSGPGATGGGDGAMAEISGAFSIRGFVAFGNNLDAATHSAWRFDQAQGTLREFRLQTVNGTSPRGIVVTNGSAVTFTKVVGSLGVGSTYGVEVHWQGRVYVSDPNTGTTLYGAAGDVLIGALGAKTWANIVTGGAVNTTDAVEELCTCSKSAG